MQYNCKHHNQNKQPSWIHSILVCRHEIFTKVHCFQIKQRKCINDRGLDIPEVSKLISPYLPDDHCHQQKHKQITCNKVGNIRSSNTDYFENHRHSSRDYSKLDQHNHVHKYQNRIVKLCVLVLAAHQVWINVFIVSENLVNVIAPGEDHEQKEVFNVHKKHCCVPNQEEVVRESWG